MFTIARSLVRNKIFILALLLAGYFLFAGNKEAPKPKSAGDTVSVTQPGAVAAHEDIADLVDGNAHAGFLPTQTG